MRPLSTVFALSLVLIPFVPTPGRADDKAPAIIAGTKISTRATSWPTRVNLPKPSFATSAVWNNFFTTPQDSVQA